MYLNSNIFLIIVLYQCLTIYCNDPHNHTTPKKQHIQQEAKIIEAAGMIIYRRNQSLVQYLLLKESYVNFFSSPPNGDKWKNESSMETALRVTEEKTGFKKKDLDIEQKSMMLNLNFRGFIREVTFWLARLIKPNQPIKLPHEDNDYEWHSKVQASLRIKSDEIRNLLLECDKHINQTSCNVSHTILL